MSGHVDATPGVLRRMLRGAWLRRVVYNAAIDSRVPFAEGVTYRLAVSRARKAGTAPPSEPVPSPTFLPIPKPQDLNRRLTELRKANPELLEYPASLFTSAIDEACKARSNHVKACGKARKSGEKMPHLRFRSVADDMDLVTANARILRCGEGKPGQGPKHKNPKSEANRLRKVQRRAKREAAWAVKKLAAGWTPNDVDLGLRRRAARQERDRQAQGDLDWSKPGIKLPRRDSPTATVNATRVKLEIQGIGRVRARLDRPIPEGGEFARLHLVKKAGRSNRVEVRLIYSIPALGPLHDELVTGAQLHRIVKALPPTATPLMAVEAIRAAGIPVRGDDWGIGSPSTDDTGRVTPNVKPIKAELRKLRDLQKRLSHKERLLLDARVEASQAAKKADAELPADSEKEKRRPPKRSRRAMTLKAQIARVAEHQANRSRTRAQQDAKRLVKGVVLVATDPQRMVKPLLAKGGPAERRAKAEAVSVLIPSFRGYALTPAQQRAMRANMHNSAIRHSRLTRAQRRRPEHGYSVARLRKGPGRGSLPVGCGG